MTELTDALEAREASALDPLFAEEVTFRSPVRTYRDRAEVVHLVRTLTGLFDETRRVRGWGGEHGAATLLEITIGELRLDGVLEELHDARGRVVELTLMLRPLTALLEAVERMGRALERTADPRSGPSPSPAGRASPR